MHITYESSICTADVPNATKINPFFQQDNQILLVVSYKGEKLLSHSCPFRKPLHRFRNK